MTARATLEALMPWSRRRQTMSDTRVDPGGVCGGRNPGYEGDEMTVEAT